VVTETQGLDLSIIVVTYRSEQLIIDCFRTLTRYTQGLSYELIVVNNGAPEEGRQVITTEFPQVKWINQGYNSGFARANNTGINAALAETVLLLNPDTIFEDNAVGNVYSLFSKSPYVACGAQLLNADHSPQIAGNYAMKGGLNYLLPLPYIGSFLKLIASIFGVKKPNVPNATGIVEVDWINGAFLVVKKEVIKKAGLLDEDFFLYAEEAEWCSRLRKYGKLCIYGQFHVMHLEGQSANKAFNASGKGYGSLTDKKGLQIMLSNMVRIRKEFGKGWFLFMLCMYTFGMIVFWIAGFFHSLIRLTDPALHFRAASGFRRNVFTLWKFAGKIIRNKPYFYKVL
jgi:GT2 family glycosyltransferase